MFEKSTEVTTVKIFNEENLPVIKISPLAMVKMAHIVDYCKDEVGWLGSAVKLNDNQYFIQDVYMFEQEVNATTCEITPDGLAKFGTEILSKPNGTEIYNNLKVWGHSHVNMGVTPSGQDDTQVKDFAGDNDWFIRIIANKKGDIKIDLFDYDRNLEFNNVNWSIYMDSFDEEIKALTEEIDSKVTQKTYAYVSSVGKKSSVKSYSSYNRKKNSREDILDKAFWDGYYDALDGLPADVTYSDDLDILDTYDDGYMSVAQYNIYQPQDDLKIIEVYTGLSQKEKYQLAFAEIKDIKEFLKKEFKIDGWSDTDIEVLQETLQDELGVG